jgi:glycosyltransferase involved in cell wall biosynthesis
MPDTQYHIAHVLPWPSVGGTEHATLRIAQAVGGEQFVSTAFCPGDASPVREMFAAGGFDTAAYRTVAPSYRHPQEFLRVSLGLAREFGRRKIDLVHCSDLLAAYYAAVAGKMARLPVLCHVRCSYPGISRRDQSFLRAVDKFVFVSQDAWRTFGYRVPERRGTVVYDGVDVDEADNNDEAAESVRREFNIPVGTLIVGMVARVAPAKDYATLARAAALVVSQHHAVRFLIVGDHSQVDLNREHYAEVRRVLADLGVAPYFIFTDHREDVARLIGAMDVFVLSTRTEGLPLVILEAMAQAKPVVATAVGGVPEVIRDGETGLLHPPQDEGRLAAQLLALLKDEALCHRLGESGRQFVKANFTHERFATSMTDLYLNLVRRGGRSAANSRSEQSLSHLGRINR